MAPTLQSCFNNVSETVFLALEAASSGKAGKNDDMITNPKQLYPIGRYPWLQNQRQIPYRVCGA
jgi:hypothetical protein